MIPRSLKLATWTLWLLAAATIVANGFWHGSIAQSILTTLQVIAVNPTLGNDPNDRRAVDISCTTDSSNINSNFSNENCLQLTQTSTNGNNTNGGLTTAKTTFIPVAITSLHQAAGQRVNFQNQANCFGMGDCSAYVLGVNYAGGPVNGDEGQGFQLFSALQQQTFLDQGTLSSVTRTTCSTTATQPIVGGFAPQTVSVASTTGCNVNDWIVIDQQLPSGTPGAEGVQITAVGAGTVTGVFVLNHNNGVTITPATVLSVSLTSGHLGQQRVMVNTSTAATYSTGTVASISGGGLTGSGTAWANNMVGGTSGNIGCAALTADDYSGAPFNSTGNHSTLKSWYQISSVNSATSLGVFSFSAAGDQAYHGNGPGSGAYIVRPCVTILKIVGGIAIAETTSTVWTVGDTIEVAISPYPDVTGFQYALNKWNPGGAANGFMEVRNGGARSYQYGFRFDTGMPQGEAGQDYIPFMSAYNCSGCGTALTAVSSADQAILLDDAWGNGTMFTGTIAGATLTASSVSGTIARGNVVIGPGVHARTFIALQLTGTPGGAGTYTVAVQGCITCTQSVGPVAMQSGSTDNGGKITWAGTGAYIMPNSANQGLDIATALPGGSLLQSKSATIVGSGSLGSLNYNGLLGTTAVNFSALPSCVDAIEGYEVAIKDSNVTTFGTQITAGGGSGHGVAHCSGTAAGWTYH